MTHEQELAELRKDRDRWRAQAERLAVALERLKAPEGLNSRPVRQEAEKLPPDGLILYGTKAIAQHLGIRQRQALHLIEQGRLPVFRSGRNVCARRSSLTDWIASQEGR